MYKSSILLALMALVCLASAAKLTAAQKANRRAQRLANQNLPVAAAANVVGAGPVIVPVVGGAAVGGAAVGAAEQQVQLQQNAALNLAQNNAGLTQAQLEKAARKQARLDAKALRQARKNQGARVSTGQKLQKSEAVDAAHYENAAVFDDTDAAASVNKANKFGLNLAQENYHKENAALSKSSGKKADSGFKINAANSLDAADLLDAEVIDQAEVNDLDAISAADAQEGILNAAEGVKKQDQFQLQAQDFTNFAGGFANGFDNFGAGNGFGGNIFGGNNGVFGR